MIRTNETNQVCKSFSCPNNWTNKHGKDAKEEFGAAPQGYLGICHPNYPNFYWLLGPGTGLGTNSIIFMIECQADLVVSRLKQMISEDARALYVKPEVMADYEDWSRETMKERTFGGAATCDAWYKNSEGYNWTLWPADCITYWSGGEQEMPAAVASQ